jgi:hypothetical protein
MDNNYDENEHENKYKKRSRSRSPIREINTSNNKIEELEKENSEYKTKITKLIKEVDRANILVSTREKKYLDERLYYISKLNHYDEMYKNNQNEINYLLNKKDTEYQIELINLHSQIDILNTKINKLIEDRNNEMMKQIVEQRVIALDTLVLELNDKAKQNIELIEQKNLMITNIQKELSDYKSLYDELFRKNKLIKNKK